MNGTEIAPTHDVAKVNFSTSARVHAYARGKAPHLSAALDLLRHFTDAVWADQGGAHQVMAFEDSEEQTPVEPSPGPQHQSWDQWEVFEMRQFRCPATERVWYSDDSGSTYFMPDASGLQSVCANWVAYQDHEVGTWWCNESSRQLVFSV